MGRDDGDDGAPERTRTNERRRENSNRTNSRKDDHLLDRPASHPAREVELVLEGEHDDEDGHPRPRRAERGREEDEGCGRSPDGRRPPVSMPPKQELLRLEGFEEPWEMFVLNGKECMEDQTLADCGISKDNNTVTTVRKVLVAEGWKIKTGGLDDSDTDEDDF